MGHDFLVAVIAGVPGVAAVIGTAVVGWRSGRTERFKAETEADVSVSGAWQQLFGEVRDAQVRLQARVSELEGQVAEQAALLECQRDVEDRLRSDLAAVYAWIEAGSVPPPPTRPDYLRG